jgi:hypothetical protein
MGWDEEPVIFGEHLEPEAADVLDTAIEAAGGDGQLDDLVLLGGLLDAGDEGVLTVLGSRIRSLIAAVDSARADQARAPERALPFADDLVTVAAGEAFATAGSSTVGPVHLLLALFAFPGTSSEALLHECGVEWRPLRSIARRLLRRSFDW